MAISSPFEELWAVAGFPALAQTLGEAVVYTPPNNGAPVSLTAPFAEKHAEKFDRAQFKKKLPRRAVLEAPLSVVINGTPTPIVYSVDGAFTVRGELWRVDDFGDRTTTHQTIELKIAGDIQLDRVK